MSGIPTSRPRALRFRLPALFMATAVVAVSLAIDRALAGTTLSFAFRALVVIVLWAATLILLETASSAIQKIDEN